jgi:hypothetical protein
MSRVRGDDCVRVAAPLHFPAFCDLSEMRRERRMEKGKGERRGREKGWKRGNSNATVGNQARASLNFGLKSSTTL